MSWEDAFSLYAQVLGNKTDCENSSEDNSARPENCDCFKKYNVLYSSAYNSIIRDSTTITLLKKWIIEMDTLTKISGRPSNVNIIFPDPAVTQDEIDFCVAYTIFFERVTIYTQLNQMVDVNDYKSFNGTVETCTGLHGDFLNITGGITSETTKEKYDLFIECLARDSPLKESYLLNRHTLLGYILQTFQYAPAREYITNIEQYVNRLVEYKWLKRTTSWVGNDPRLLSFKNRTVIEKCHFDGEVICYKSDSVIIYCNGSKVSEGSTATVLSKLKFEFIYKRNPNATFKITVDGSADSLPITFDGTTDSVLKNPAITDQEILYIKKREDGNNDDRIIFDLRNRLIIHFGRRMNNSLYLTVRADDELFYKSGSTDNILIDGCPVKWLEADKVEEKVSIRLILLSVLCGALFLT
jgi:hypothetical protein